MGINATEDIPRTTQQAERVGPPLQIQENTLAILENEKGGQESQIPKTQSQFNTFKEYMEGQSRERDEWREIEEGYGYPPYH